MENNNSISIVEGSLRSQRETWREISERVSQISGRELPPEPPKRVLLFGIGSSHFAARLSGYALIRDRSRARLPVVACSSMEIGTEVLPTKGDWAFGLSHRGKTGPTLQALQACERAGAFTVMVAGRDVTEAPGARFVLPTSPMERCEPHTISVTGAICAVTTLLMGPKVVEEWDALRSIGDPDLALLRKRAGQGPEVLLGEWEGEWMAREGALKLMEMAGLPVRAFGSEEFFHGPKWSIKAGAPIWHVSTPKDPRNSDIEPAYRFGVFGSSPLAWVPTLVELQWMALAVALNRGIEPDFPEKR